MPARTMAMARLAVDEKPVTHSTPSRAKKVRYFVQHFGEMCLAMCAGMMIGTPLYVWSMGLIGFGDPLRQLPELSTLVAAFVMTVPMVAWMRYRRMQWRPINEMSAAMFVEAVVLIGAYWLGLIPGGALVGLEHALMMPAMLVPMFLRTDVYTGKCH